jgi:hypothetical protein
MANLEDFSLPFSKKEKIEELNSSLDKRNVLYFATFSNKIKKIDFSYFDLKENQFKNFSFDIKVNDETVSTQSDIKPLEDTNKIIKAILFLSIALLFALLYFWRRSAFAITISIISAIYGLYLSFPIKQICIKKGAKVRVLPTKKSTIFFIPHKNITVKEIMRKRGYIKIQLPQNKIGWVKNEATCED